MEYRLMIKPLFLLTTLSTALTLTACSKPNEQTAAPTNTSTAQTIASQSTSSDMRWTGHYKGILPCADCNGIETELELKSDYSYELSEEYLGKNNSDFKSKGNFTFDDKTNIVTLDHQGQNRKFFVGDNFVELRDMQTGQAFETKLNYKMIKEMNH